MANRLANETSPYLLQHAEQPVDWQPWDARALEAARATDRPILLSIGYSTCHWCHVMARESFSDPEIARLANEWFVNVKVDREERPDLDRVYQTTHQLLTRESGGWPLTVFLDPHTGVPFFSGTYFPPRPRHGRPDFPRVLRSVHEAWTHRRDALREQGDTLLDLLGSLRSEAEPASGTNVLEVFSQFRDAAERLYDPTHGGFGRAPRFPVPTLLRHLLGHWRRSGRRDRLALEMVLRSVTAMARGGLFDHLGGGFFRYATDERWAVPHFEKMLYDNGQLLSVYADALAVGPDPLFEATVRETVAWLDREMSAEDGRFHAALDADTEGQEGAYYIWTRREVARALDDPEALLLVETLYGLDKPAVFEGRWHLARRDAWRAVVERLGLDRGTADARLAAARAQLLAVREQRPRPFRDDKIIASWNGLVVHGLARAGRVLGEPRWIDRAARCLEALRARHWDGQRLRSVARGEALRPEDFLDDYACVLHGTLECLRARWNDGHAAFARSLAETAIARFLDPASGAFAFTAHDHEALIHRPRGFLDDALPSGNALMAGSLLTLGHLYAEPAWLECAEGVLSAGAGTAARAPAASGALLDAAAAAAEPPPLVVLHGPGARLEAWQEPLRNRPDLELFAIPNDGPVGMGGPDPGTPAHRPPFLPRLQSGEARAQVCAYVCRGLTCSAPIRSPEALAAQLD